jgi:hypothetical protein
VTQTKLMEQRLIRGTPVTIADSFGQAHLRGQKQVVASKGPVKCNGKGRCAGDWCIGLAVFVTDPETTHDDKDMGWRSGTTKVCLTHLKDEEGTLILPPPAMKVAQEALRESSVANTPVLTPTPVVQPPRPVDNAPVSWEELAQASAERDLGRVILLARRLKSENEALRQKLVDTQAKLIEHLNAR